MIRKIIQTDSQSKFYFTDVYLIYFKFYEILHLEKINFRSHFI